MRLGQLIANAVPSTQALYYIEDHELVAKIFGSQFPRKQDD